jgi:hypothetical protein
VGGEVLVTVAVEESVGKDFENLLKSAMEHPGVAEVMKAYGQYQTFLAQTEAYLEVLTDEPVFSVTDSSSQ